jgi:hypothetical protein
MAGLMSTTSCKDTNTTPDTERQTEAVLLLSTEPDLRAGNQGEQVHKKLLLLLHEVLSTAKPWPGTAGGT